MPGAVSLRHKQIDVTVKLDGWMLSMKMWIYRAYSTALGKNIGVSSFKENMILVASCQEEKSSPIGKSQTLFQKKMKCGGHDIGQ